MSLFIGKAKPPSRRISLVLALAIMTSAAGNVTADPSDHPTDATSPPMVLIEPGSFFMGSPQQEPMSRVDEVRHRVVVSRAFWLSAVEVTQALWAEVMGDHPGYFVGCPDCPIEQVSWLDAVEFCNALSRRERLTPAYDTSVSGVRWRRDADGYRLPTEAEWEYACRGGSVTAFGPGACLGDDQANYNAYRPLPGCPEGMHRGEPIPVASLAPNAWGLHDMHGNVAEWCWDWYGSYDHALNEDPCGPEQGRARIMRGGSWDSPASHCRAAFRASVDPSTTSDMLGLRVARSVQRPEDRR